jgi:hypothetical protein
VLVDLNIPLVITALAVNAHLPHKKCTQTFINVAVIPAVERQNAVFTRKNTNVSKPEQKMPYGN